MPRTSQAIETLEPVEARENEEMVLPRRTKHAELTVRLRALVKALQPGDRLPAQEELMRQYQVSDRTVLRSLDDLSRAGLIVRRPGSGTYVSGAADLVERAAAAQVAHAATVPLSRGSRTVTAVAPHFFAASYLRCCADFLSTHTEAAGISLVCHAAKYESSLQEIQSLTGPQPGDFVLFGYPMAALGEQLIRQGNRVVVVGTPPADTDPTVPCVCADHDFGGRLAAQHLLEWGHRRLAFAFDGQMRYPYRSHPRWQGHQGAIDAFCKSNGERVSDTVIDAPTLAAWRTDASLAAAYFGQKNAPTAVAVWNDSAAIVLLGILHRAGLRVPDHVSLLGFDALPEGADSIPPLTTIDHHLDWQMQTVVRLLTRPAPPPPQSIISLPTLLVRASCGPPPSSSLPSDGS